MVFKKDEVGARTKIDIVHEEKEFMMVNGEKFNLNEALLNTQSFQV